VNCFTAASFFFVHDLRKNFTAAALVLLHCCVTAADVEGRKGKSRGEGLRRCIERALRGHF
jgi:hypothetical protein